MMVADIPRLLFALGLPMLTGALFVMALWPARGPGYRTCVLGLSFPLGMVGVIAGYLVLGHWAIGLHFWSNVGIQIVLSAVFGALVWWRWRGQVICIEGTGERWHELSLGCRWMLGLVVAWLMLRWFGLLLEVVFRPLFPWDAWYAYGINAKVWFFQPYPDVFANGLRWFQDDGRVWATGGTRHPAGIGLMQLWMTQALGRYDDALMNLAWPVVCSSLGLILFGWLRLAGVRLQIALAATALAFTLPVVNTQATLAGYGDLWIGVLFLTAGTSLWAARQLDQPWLIMVVLVAIAGMLLIKETSLMWVPMLALGMLVGWVRLQWMLLVATLAIIGFFAVLWLHGEPVRVSTLGRLGFGEDGFEWPSKIGFDMWREITMWPALLKHLLVYENWHLYWYVVPVLSVVGIRWLGADDGLRMLWFMFVGGVALLVAFFSLTSLGNAVNDGTSVNRLLLHVVPLGALLAGVIADRLVDRLTTRRWVVAE